MRWADLHRRGIFVSAAESSWGSGRPSISSHNRQHDDSHTQLPWAPQPHEWLGLTQEGR